jgi:adenosylcobinamide-GDP ribazoletransferase
VTQEPANQASGDSATTWECFTIAIEFLTRVPVTRVPVTGAIEKSAEFYLSALRRSVVFFPIVGGLVGLFTALVFAACLGLGISPLVAALIALGMEAGLTGALHEDAFADTWDALGGGRTREQVLEIMKDSRLGTYGTIALVVGVGARAAAMAAIGESDVIGAMAAIVAAATIGRIAIVLMMATTAPITDRHSQARDISATQTLLRAATATLISLPLWIVWPVISPLLAGVSLFASAIVLLWFRRKLIKRVGGTTGDLLGCSGFLTQLVMIIGASVQ